MGLLYLYLISGKLKHHFIIIYMMDFFVGLILQAGG